MLVCAALAVALGCEPQDENNEVIEPGTAECTRDEQSEPGQAVALGAEPANGYICPLQDKDWYSLTMPAEHTVLQVELSMQNPLSPVDVTYAVFERSEGEPENAVVSAPATGIGQKLDDVHCIPPGDYLLVVQDSGDDREDTRNQYALDVSTAPDPDAQEPNDETGSATVLTDGQAVTGYVACVGDEDYYAIDVPDGNLVRLKLTSEISTYEPQLELLDETGNTLVDESNPAASNTATDIDRFEVLPGAGRYYVRVADNDGEDADPDVAYTLLVEYIVDSDPNEPNNHPSEAVELSGSDVGCTGTWQTFGSEGTIGSPGDDDWFEIPLAGCATGIIEAEVTLNTSGLSVEQQWELAAEVQAAISMVRAHPSSTCEEDRQCNTLNLACSQPLDCAGYLETCLGEGLCAGATVCLPSGRCGANTVSRHYSCPARLSECQPGAGAPPPNRARFAAPLFGEDVVYLRVSDFQANGAAPERLYDLSVRVIEDPDDNESNNLFVSEISPDWGAEIHQPQAVPIQVRDCTAGDCCDSGQWQSGAISYENDTDWFTYEHPCPGEDCTMRFHYQVDGGPVDAVMSVYRESRNWFTAFDATEEPMQGGISGVLGGTTAADTCFYAYQGHTGDPFRYYVEVRDLFELFSDDKTVRPESRDWDPSQSYSFCVEKISNVCEEPPCQIYDDGCGQPQ